MPKPRGGDPVESGVCKESTSSISADSHQVRWHRVTTSRRSLPGAMWVRSGMCRGSALGARGAGATYSHRWRSVCEWPPVHWGKGWLTEDVEPAFSSSNRPHRDRSSPKTPHQAPAPTPWSAAANLARGSRNFSHGYNLRNFGRSSATLHHADGFGGLASSLFFSRVDLDHVAGGQCATGRQFTRVKGD